MNKSISLVLIGVTVCALAVAIWNENGTRAEKTRNDTLQTPTAQPQAQ